MNYRLIIARKDDGFRQMAVDEAILNGVASGSSLETVRFFDFSPIAVTVGRLQHVDTGLIDACRRNHVDLVRRLTGGRLVVHAGDFTFSFIIRASNPDFGGSVYKTYRAVSAPFLSALHDLGIPVRWQKAFPQAKNGELDERKSALCFDATSRYEIVVGGQKILGISQYRRSDTILVQGTLLIAKPEPLYKALFGDRTTTNGFSSVSDAHNGPVDFSLIGRIVSDEIKETYGAPLSEGPLSHAEEDEARRLAEKYRTRKWLEKGG